MAKQIALLTEKKYIQPKKRDWYIDQVLEEDALIQKALEKKGYEVIKVDWSQADMDWSTIDLALFRAIWDYFHRIDEFKAWLKTVQGTTLFVNPLSLIQWNIDKHYLIDLKNKGVPIVDTRIIEQGSFLSLQKLHEASGWQKMVLKPCISGSARHTYLLDPENLSAHEGVFKELISNESMMLQPFQNNIITKGEVSHIVIGGKYTHSVLKKAMTGDYRVQDDFGGSVHPYTANKNEIQFAEKVVSSCDEMPLYARVDVVWDNKHELALSELELIEPELWFRENPAAAEQLADTIHNLL
ncbi:MAG: hypothetical protein WDZ35_13585 [Crocinitomicaceae bacterium]